MHLVIIGARNTGTSLNLVDQALARGLHVTVITAEHDDLTHVFKEEVNVVTLTVTADNVAGYIQNVIRKDSEYIRVTTAHDMYASVAAQVSNRLGIPGPDAEAVSRCVSKKYQDVILNSLGCRLGASCQYNLDNELYQSRFEHLTFPVVLKPVKGSASHGIRKCHTPAEVSDHMQCLREMYKALPKIIPSGDIMIESFINGPEYCVEIFDGQFAGIMAKKKKAGDLFIERGYTSETDLSVKAIRNIAALCEHVVATMNLCWGPVHIDCITESDNVHIIEVNPRIAGSFITDIIRDAWGFDMVNALLNKLNGSDVFLPERAEPSGFAQVIFFLDSDPEILKFKETGFLSAEDVRLSFSPQILTGRDRRSYLYLTVR